MLKGIKKRKNTGRFVTKLVEKLTFALNFFKFEKFTCSDEREDLPRLRYFVYIYVTKSQEAFSTRISCAVPYFNYQLSSKRCRKNERNFPFRSNSSFQFISFQIFIQHGNNNHSILAHFHMHFVAPPSQAGFHNDR